MSGLDWEQLEALKRQLEEDFKMDMAAIERLQRRFRQAQDKPPVTTVAAASNISVIETRPAAAPKVEPVAQAEPDELEGSLRTMFSNFRK